MSDFTWRLEWFNGFEQTVTNLRQLPLEIAGKVLDGALRTSGVVIAEDAGQIAPRSDDPSRAGHMADSIQIRKVTDRESTNDLESNYTIGPDRGHFYAMFNEFGTVHETARPFMRPTFDRDAQRVIDSLGRALGAAVDRAAKRMAK